MAGHSQGSHISKSVSLPPDLFEAADARRRKLHYATFSAYVVQLIREDLASRPPHVKQEGGKVKGSYPRGDQQHMLVEEK